MQKMHDAPRRDSSSRPVGEIIRSASPVCTPNTTVRVAAQTMSAARSRYVVVPMPSGMFGIFTDGDMRRRIVAAGVDTDSPIGDFVTSPAVMVAATRSGADVLMDMLASGFRQMPVVSPAGDIVGVVEDTDLYATATRAGFLLRSNIARATDADDLAEVCSAVPTLAVSLSDARVSPVDIGSIYSVLVESAVKRAVDLARADIPVEGFSWLTLGSVARREALPSSDVESGLIISDNTDLDTATTFGSAVHSILDRCGFRRDPNNALASQRRFTRTLPAWTDSVDEWIGDPFADQGIVMLSLLADAVISAGGRVAGGTDVSTNAVTERIRRDARACSLMLRECTEDRARLPLRDRFFRRSESMDVKETVLAPITGIARWAGIRAGTAEKTTLRRLTDAADAGVLTTGDAAVLSESFEVVQQVRLRHQCEQIRVGVAADDRIQFDELTPLAKSLLGNAVREVSGVQRTLAYDA